MGGPAPYGSSWGPGSEAQPQDDELRTIFVLGFPTDVKERELQNLLRWWPGYESCQMNFKGEQPMGFALFSTGAMAIAARDALQNLVFDSESNSVLRAEMAKKNLFVKKGGMAQGEAKRVRTGPEFPQALPPPPPPQYPSYVPPPPPGWGMPGWGAPPMPPGYDTYGYQIPPPPPVAMPHAPPSSYSTVPHNNKDNPPCNTLFVGNLGENTSEPELRGMFANQPGFKQIKVLHQGAGLVCFVEFVDVQSAINAHASMQGSVLQSSDRGGMRIQFSKNPFGRKRDWSSQGPPAASGTGAGAASGPAQSPPPSNQPDQVDTSP